MYNYRNQEDKDIQKLVGYKYGNHNDKDINKYGNFTCFHWTPSDQGIHLVP